MTYVACRIFYSVLRPFQDYFSSYETGQSVGGAKTGEPRKKSPGTPASPAVLCPLKYAYVLFCRNERWKDASTQ